MCIRSSETVINIVGIALVDEASCSLSDLFWIVPMCGIEPTEAHQ